MKHIKITADSTCDLPPSILRELDITLMPLYVLAGDQAYRDGVNITPADIFRYVEEKGKACKTGAINAYEYEHFFAELSQKYEAVIHVCIGSTFSSCYQNAVIAAQNLQNVYVVDSHNLSSGSGHVVCAAAQMAMEGISPKDICEKLDNLIPRVDASFVISQLEHLHKGGRCSGLESYRAKLLQIKPCIEVIDGKMAVGKKYKGNLGHCIKRYIKNRLCGNQDIDYSRVFLTHTVRSLHIVAIAKEAIRNYADFKEIIEIDTGCAISCHCGPDALGILFKRRSRKESSSFI